MKRLALVFVFFCLAFPVWAAKDFTPVPVVAILYFDNATGVDHLKWLPKGFLDLLIRDFQTVESFKVIPRDKIEEAVRLYPEQAKDKHKLLKIHRIGKLLDATHVITGKFSRQDTNLLIEVRVYSMKHSAQKGWRQVEGPSEDVLYLQKQASMKILELMETRISDRDLISLMQLPTRDMKAFAYYAMGIDAHDHGDRDLARQYFQSAIAADKYFKPAVEAVSGMAFVLSGKAVLRAVTEETKALGVSGVNSVSDLIELARTNAFDFDIGEPVVSPIEDDTTRVNVKVPFQVIVRQEFVNFWMYAIRRLGASAAGDGSTYALSLARQDLFDQPVSISLPGPLAEEWLAAWRKLSMRLLFENPEGRVLFEAPPQPVLPLYIADSQDQFEPGQATFWKVDTAFEIERVPKQFFDEPLQVSLEIDR